MIDFALKFLENKSKKSLTYWKDQIKYSGACKAVCFAQKALDCLIQNIVNRNIRYRRDAWVATHTVSDIVCTLGVGRYCLQHRKWSNTKAIIVADLGIFSY